VKTEPPQSAAESVPAPAAPLPTGPGRIQDAIGGAPPAPSLATPPAPSGSAPPAGQPVLTAPPKPPAAAPDTSAAAKAIPAAPVQTPSATVTAPARPAANPALLAMLLRRGNGLLALGDVSGARRFYERAAESGSAEAAEAAARTYDPAAFAALGVLGIRPDPEAAAIWYRRAAALRAAERGLPQDSGTPR
jgi:hypothetical protein